MPKKELKPKPELEVKKTCFYYGEKEKPCESDEGVAWVDPKDGSDPFPNLVTYRSGEWRSTGLSGELEPVDDIGEILCVQKLKDPSHRVEKKECKNEK